MHCYQIRIAVKKKKGTVIPKSHKHNQPTNLQLRKEFVRVCQSQFPKAFSDDISRSFFFALATIKEQHPDLVRISS